MDEAGDVLGKTVLHLKPGWIMPFVKLGVRLGWLSQGQLEWVQTATNGPILVSSERARERLGWRPVCNVERILVRYGVSAGENDR
jgi:hypothetical protein